jgi:hypothetical protein
LVLSTEEVAVPKSRLNGAPEQKANGRRTRHAERLPL